jgi:low temperature requirement protein LtrA
MRKIFSPAKDLITPHEQGADFVELFFDLVFVYAITRITSLTAHHIDTNHVIQSMFIFWLIWWGWTQFTWTLNAANTKIAEVRMMVLVATAVAFIMASSVGDAFGKGVMWFALPYVVIRVIGIGLYIRITNRSNTNRSRIIAFTIPSVIAWIALLIGALTDPTQRVWWWIIAIVFDMMSAYFGGRAEGWDLKPKHFAERHGLIVIIALGESLIVAANAVSSHERSQTLLVVGGLALLVTCLLWWSYFSWINEHLEEQLSRKTGSKQAQLGAAAYSLMHFPLVFGIIGIAVGFEKILTHSNDLLSMPVALTLGGGYFLFVGFTAASVWRTSKLILMPRLIILVVSSIAVAFSVGYPSYIALGIISVSLILVTFIEWNKCRHS